MEESTKSDKMDLFVSLSFDQTIKRVLRIFVDNWRCFLTISTLAVGLRYVLTFISDVVNGPTAADYNMEDSAQDLAEVSSSVNDAATVTMYVVDSLIFYVVMCLNDGATVRATAELYMGETPDAVTSIGSAAQKLGSLIGASLLITFILLVPFVLLMAVAVVILLNGTNPQILIMVMMALVAVYIYLVTFFAYPAIIVENESIKGSISRSYELTGNYLWEIFSLTLVFSSVRWAVGLTLTSFTLSNSLASRICGNVLLFGLSVIFTSLTAILKAVLYFKVRLEKEDYNQEKLATDLGQNFGKYVEMNENKSVATSASTKKDSEIV